MKIIFHIAVCVALVFSAAVSLRAQNDQELAAATVKALTYFKNQQFSEAIPHFEVVIKAIPDNAQARFMYGFCLLAKSKQIGKQDEAKQLSDKALEQFQKAKELGLKNPDNDALIALLTGKATASEDAPTYSPNKEADKLMVEGENFFAQSKYDEAIKKFEKALALDPRIYQAALSAGDSYVAKGDFENAEKWYQKGIAINPDRETAYRYSATPFMKQKKYDQARERYIEAYISEPYNNMSHRGIGQWAQITGATLGHPEVSVPEVSFDSNGKAIPKPAIAGDDAAMRPWLNYLAAREAWKKEKFAKSFPKESSYRHTLNEEVEALRAAVSAAKEQKSSNKQFEILGKMDAEGVLEAFILLAQTDDGIAADYAEYLKNNRAKLRQYVSNYVIHK